MEGKKQKQNKGGKNRDFFFFDTCRFLEYSSGGVVKLVNIVANFL